MYLEHHGIKGQKWGERKYQYKDGSLTPEGRKRYGVLGSTKAYIKQRRKNVDKFYKESKNLGDDKLPSQMTKKERAIYDKAEANYSRRQKQAGKQYRADLKRGLADKATKTKNFAKMYHDVSKVEMKELMNPSSTGEMIFSGARAKLHGRSFASGHREYAYRKSIDYARKKYGDSAATKIETTDAAFKIALYAGAAAFGAYRAYKSTHPTYEVP